MQEQRSIPDTRSRVAALLVQQLAREPGGRFQRRHLIRRRGTLAQSHTSLGSHRRKRSLVGRRNPLRGIRTPQLRNHTATVRDQINVPILDVPEHAAELRLQFTNADRSHPGNVVTQDYTNNKPPWRAGYLRMGEALSKTTGRSP